MLHKPSCCAYCEFLEIKDKTEKISNTIFTNDLVRIRRYVCGIDNEYIIPDYIVSIPDDCPINWDNTRTFIRRKYEKNK